MTPAARLAAAIEVLDDVEVRHRPVAQALKDWGVSHRFAGSKDRSAIGNLVYDALRWRGSTAAAMAAETPRALVLGTVGRRWGLGAAGLAAMIEGDRHAPPPPDEDEARRIDAPASADMAETARADIPDWLAPAFTRALGEHWAEEGEALALRPPLDLRVNRLKADHARVLKALERFGAVPAPLAPDAIRIPPTAGDGRHPNVTVEPGFQKGWFEIQDEGSQLAALLIGARSGEQVLDLCAGAGGKTLALATAMDNKGQIHATDADRTRLAPIFDRLKRAGTRNVQVRDAGAPLDDLVGRMDRVLIDAPCTGTGTWRRRPDAKWRLSERALGERIAEQDTLLEGAADYVRPGGLAVYVTCSLLLEEGPDRIAAFTAARPDFEALTAEAIVAGAALPDEVADRIRAAMLSVPGGLMLTPRRSATDGFFVAALRRRAEDAPQPT